MTAELTQDLFELYSKTLQPPYFGGIRKWAEDNIVLPAAYSINGHLDLSLSPYLHKPLADLDNPQIAQINLGMATQIGKSLIQQLAIAYWIINEPGPIYYIFHNNEIAANTAEQKLIPLLKACQSVKPLLAHDRFSTRKTGIVLPHMAVTIGGANEGKAHSASVKYLLCDELHQWDVGMFGKFLARTTAFTGRRKIVCASQPNLAGSDWDNIFHKGLVYEWQWLCPQCKTRQPFHWSKEKPDNKGYAGFNWDTILNADGTTNIAASSKTTWLECCNCDCRIHDTPTERRNLNDTGDYVCIKADGDSTIVSYSCPQFVYLNIPFSKAATEYMIAKKYKKDTGLDTPLKDFVEQVLAKFYKREESIDISCLLIEAYDKEFTSLKESYKDWRIVMGVDVQRVGKVKYYVVRAFNKNGNESRRLDFGIARTWEEIEAIRAKYQIMPPLVLVDSGDGETVLEVYQECIKHGREFNKAWVNWTPTKGDGNKLNYKHSDGVTRLFSPVSPQDAQFPQGHKFKGIPANLVMFSNYSVKTILANLRDNQLEGIKWKVDSPDTEYDKHIYSESLVDVVDKKSGNTVKRWEEVNKGNNHYWDCEVLCLVGAMMGKVFTATATNEADIASLTTDRK